MYIDSASCGDYIKSKTWQPKNRCEKVWGGYVDFDSRTFKKATIESHVMDTGGGFSYCSNCQESIDISKLDLLKGADGKMYCLKCNSQLEFGRITTNGGGSDF